MLCYNTGLQFLHCGSSSHSQALHRLQERKGGKIPATVPAVRIPKALAIDHKTGFWSDLVPQTLESFGHFLAGRSQPLCQVSWKQDTRGTFQKCYTLFLILLLKALLLTSTVKSCIYSYSYGICTCIHKIPNLVQMTKKSPHPHRNYIVLVYSGRSEAQLGRDMIMAIHPTQAKTGSDRKQ